LPQHTCRPQAAPPYRIAARPTSRTASPGGSDTLIALSACQEQLIEADSRAAIDEACARPRPCHAPDDAPRRQVANIQAAWLTSVNRLLLAMAETRSCNALSSTDTSTTYASIAPAPARQSNNVPAHETRRILRKARACRNVLVVRSPASPIAACRASSRMSLFEVEHSRNMPSGRSDSADAIAALPAPPPRPRFFSFFLFCFFLSSFWFFFSSFCHRTAAAMSEARARGVCRQDRARHLDARRRAAVLQLVI